MLRFGVYLSHSSSDNSFSQRLAWALRGAGVEVWFDPHVRNAATPASFTLNEAVNRSMFLVVVSREALASAWVKAEFDEYIIHYTESLTEIDFFLERLRRQRPDYASVAEANRFYVQRHIVPVVIDSLSADDCTGDWHELLDMITSATPLGDSPPEDEILRRAIEMVGATILPYTKRLEHETLMLPAVSERNTLKYLPAPLEVRDSVDTLIRAGKAPSVEEGSEEPQVTDEDSSAVWCVVANVAEEQRYGREIRSGTKHFAAGAKVYCLPAQWGDGYEEIVVIGHHRESHRYVKMVFPSKRLTNWRAHLVYSPYVLKEIGDNWDGTLASRRYAEELVQICQGREADQARLSGEPPA